MSPPAAARWHLVVWLPLATLLVGCSLVKKPAPPVDPAVELLAYADARLAAGEVAAAADAYREVAAKHPRHDAAPRALLQLAALRLDRASPVHDPDAAAGALRRIEADHPASIWAPAARAALALMRANRGLERSLAVATEQLEAIKRLDLAPDG